MIAASVCACRPCSSSQGYHIYQAVLCSAHTLSKTKLAYPQYDANQMTCQLPQLVLHELYGRGDECIANLQLIMHPCCMSSQCVCICIQTLYYRVCITDIAQARAQAEQATISTASSCRRVKHISQPTVFYTRQNQCDTTVITRRGFRRASR